MRRRLATLLAAGLLAVAPLLTSCSIQIGETRDEPRGVEFIDAWAKSGDEGGMTGVFGTLANPNEYDLVFDRFEIEAADSIELHEITADGIMREIDGEVKIPAGGSLVLAPGEDHLMLMGLREDLLAGDEVTFAVHFTSLNGPGLVVALTVPVKDYAGASEEYAEHGGHEHGGHEHADDADAAHEHDDL